MVIINNINFPKMSFHKAQSQMLQSEIEHKVYLRHTGWIQHPITISWTGKIKKSSETSTTSTSSIDQSAMDYYKNLHGLIMFGQESEEVQNKGSMYAEQDAWIVINPYPLPLPSKITEIEFKLKIEETAKSFKGHEIEVKVGEFDTHVLQI